MRVEHDINRASLAFLPPRDVAAERGIELGFELDLQLIEIASRDAPAATASPATDDAVAEGLRRAGVLSSSELDRKFFSWYWSLMSPA